MNYQSTSVSDEKSVCLPMIGRRESGAIAGRISHHFLNDPKAKFILTQQGDVLNANLKASDLLGTGVLSRASEGKLGYGSSEMNGYVRDILEQLRLGRAHNMKLLKRHEDDWIVLEFSTAEFNANKEILLTVSERSMCKEDSLRALSRAFGFTITEAEVVKHMSMALCPKEIGLSMDISTNTVRAHLRSIYSKLGIRGYNGALRLILQLIG